MGMGRRRGAKEDEEEDEEDEGGVGYGLLAFRAYVRLRLMDAWRA